jgi:Mg-chelatase subunit ChlD
MLYVSQTVRVKSLEQELADTRQNSISQQLIGLKGKLHHVVVIIDRSGSMKYGRKWEYTQTIIATWLRYLPIDACALLIFNDRVDAFPSNGTYLDFKGPRRDEKRAEVLKTLAALEPSGNTNTLEALRRAYSYQDVDTIILFTDGVPDSGSNRFDQKMAESIYELCREHGTAIPINTVGLGEYFDKQFGEFLLRLPELTGGTFLGR